MDTYEIEKCTSVQEVFDAVVEIAEGFEKIIDSQGNIEVVKSVLKKVVWALEHLRNCALVNERLECELTDLKIKISQLEYDKGEKAKLRRKFDEELEQIEEYWKKESKNLNIQITKLQQENQRLQKHQAEESELPEDENENVADETILNLKETVNNQRNHLHAKDVEIYTKAGEIDALEKQLSKTRDVSEKLRHELTGLKRDTQRLLEEKLELQGSVQDHERQLHLLQNALHEMLGAAASDTGEEGQETEDSISTLQLSRLTPAQLRHMLCEMKDVKLRLKYLEEEVSVYRERRPSLLMETDLAMRLEAQMQQNTDVSSTPDHSPSRRSSLSDQDSNESYISQNASENSDKELSLEAEWVQRSDVPAQCLVDQQIRDKHLMARRPSAITKFFSRVFSSFAVREEQPMPLAYFSTRRSSAGII